ncbi:MAG: redox-regulated ATPase YchF [Nitrososphaerales archaeon]
MVIRIGIIGKTNTGKTTFFNSATMQSSEVSTYPFTTKKPNVGRAYVISLCVHREFRVKDNPQNSLCIEGWRYIPIELIDLPGLIKGAWLGKGLGNQFLSVAAQSDALIHVVDSSGSIDAEGRITSPGTGDPLADLADIEEEVIMWYLKLLEGNFDKIVRNIKTGTNITQAMVEIFGGIGVKENHVKISLKETDLEGKDIENWNMDDKKKFVTNLREISKPTLIVANKMDLPYAEDNFKRIVEKYKDIIIVPASAEAELTLRKAEQAKLIKYHPSDERFEIVKGAKLNERQRWALNYIKSFVFEKYLRTGVQFALNVAVFKLLRMNVVYPVYDPNKLSDKKGNILPDAFLLPAGSQVKDLAHIIHSDLAKGLIYAIDAKTGLRLPVNYEIKDRDVLSLVSTTIKRS